jgi:hypothetical protein
VGSQFFSLDAPGFQQFAVGSFAGAVPVGRAQVQVIRGRAAGYSVVNDNITGDSSLFAFEQLPAGWQDVLVNGVARANGRNGTFFRTDGRFYNPTTTDATVRSHSSRAGVESVVATASFVPPGRQDPRRRRRPGTPSTCRWAPQVPSSSEGPVGIAGRATDLTGQNTGTSARSRSRCRSYRS